MPKLTLTVDAEQAAFDKTVKEINEWWATAKQSHIERYVQTYYFYLVHSDEFIPSKLVR